MFRARVLIDADDTTTSTLLRQVLTDAGYAPSIVESGDTLAEALSRHDPHVLLQHLSVFTPAAARETLVTLDPWIGHVIIASADHLALLRPDVGDSCQLLARGDIHDTEQITGAVDWAVRGAQPPVTLDPEHVCRLTPTQADVLRLVAAGYSNTAIAQVRGTSIRSVEAVINRIMRTLNLDDDPDYNNRVQAALHWQGVTRRPPRISGAGTPGL